MVIRVATGRQKNEMEVMRCEGVSFVQCFCRDKVNRGRKLWWCI